MKNISVSRIGQFLREAAVQPHRRRMWLNTKEQDADAFQPAVETVCETYTAAPERHAQQGTHTVCSDEMTGLQALERIAPGKPLQPPQRTDYCPPHRRRKPSKVKLAKLALSCTCK